MGNNTGDNISSVLGLDGLDQVDESTLPDAGSEEALESSYDLQEPPTTEDDGGEPPAAQPEGRKQLVPLGALQEERTKRQEKERQLEESTAQQQRMQERFNEMMMRLQGVQTEKPVEQEEALPDFHEDPAGHVEGLKKQFTKQLAEMQEFIKQSQGQSQQNTQHQQLAQRASASEVEFRKTTPDYDEAANFFQARKMAEYAAFGLDPVAAQQQLSRDCTGIVQGATHRNANPAEVMYNLAKALGYTKAAPATQNRQAVPKAPTTLANVSSAPKAPDEDNGGELSLAKVTNMTDKEFDEFWAKQSRGQIQRPKF